MQENKLFKKQIINILSAALALAVTFFSYGVISFGWFSQNKAVDADGIEMNLAYEDIQVEYSVYMWNIDAQAGSNLDKYGNIINISDITMHTHDLIFKARNKYTPVVIRIAITGSDMPVFGNAVVTIDRDTSIDVYSTQEGHTTELSEYSSSIVRVTAAKGAGYYATTSGVADINTIYNRVVNGDSANGITAIKGNETTFDTKTFTTVTENAGSYTYTKLDTLTFTIAYTQDDWNDTDGDSIPDTLNIYLLMDYDSIDASDTVPDLTEIYCIGHNINSGVISFDNKVSLKNDLVKIRADRDQSND